MYEVAKFHVKLNSSPDIELKDLAKRVKALGFLPRSGDIIGVYNCEVSLGDSIEVSNTSLFWNDADELHITIWLNG